MCAGMNPSQTEIEQLFGQYGPTNEVFLARIPPCFAFVSYKYKQDAEAAVKNLDGA